MEPGAIALAIGVDLVGRLPHGEGRGAYEVRKADGTSAVLKLFTRDVFDLGASTVLTDALRARGYPVPAIEAAGVLDGVRYEIQERMPGAPLEQATHDRVGPLRELINLQRDVGLPGRGKRLRRIAGAARGVAVSEADVVHYDFSPYNVLVAGDRITGVVDWDGATSCSRSPRR